MVQCGTVSALPTIVSIDGILKEKDEFGIKNMFLIFLGIFSVISIIAFYFANRYQ